jgi:hypothetical protein
MEANRAFKTEGRSGGGGGRDNSSGGRERRESGQAMAGGAEMGSAQSEVRMCGFGGKRRTSSPFALSLIMPGAAPRAPRIAASAWGCGRGRGRGVRVRANTANQRVLNAAVQSRQHLG